MSLPTSVTIKQSAFESGFRPESTNNHDLCAATIPILCTSLVKSSVFCAPHKNSGEVVEIMRRRARSGFAGDQAERSVVFSGCTCV
ncbi:hypothetical protein G5S34_24975 [Herbaspirillum frisingense]|uniref:hypothetical protein n=1 Tax=Herbaspirillum frisingense TaxID=92645 RepID=UPI001604843A|nr:hypothetical protein [Herbaspirillum frisingense]QNB09697.1 hypothetical protein G5S34_24975 [Herbaspirillum frisingense]